ncbi:MAG: nucleotidyltransferase family protein [Clostridiales bacterium]|nr:nucleotidyltransferase family protein [Clostridiales bacterium]
MRTAGITAEYNPFHNGHVYHIEKTRQLSGADCVIAVMSGDFTQRGEPAVCDKWERAKAAVSAARGADLVVELPFAFACSRATVFAAGAVDMLVKMGVDVISFGCEAEEPERLRNLADTLVSDAASIEAEKTARMGEGLSHAKAYELAVADRAGEAAAELLRSPNNILALEYLKRIAFWRGKGVPIEDLPVKRFGSGYHDVSAAEDAFAGAGALRNMLKKGEDIRRYVPAACSWEDAKVLSDRYLQILKGTVLRSTPEDLAHIRGIGEGLENSIIREIKTAESIDGLIAALTSRRYTGATIRRALTHVLTGTGWKEADTLTARAPSAGRLLAAGEKGRQFMREHRDGDFTVVTNLNREEEKLAPLDRQLLKLDEKAADIYNLLCGRDLYAASDRVRSPYIE